MTQTDTYPEARHGAETVRKGWRACFASYGEHHMIVMPESDPSFDAGVPSSSQWFATKEEACECLTEILDQEPSPQYERGVRP